MKILSLKCPQCGASLESENSSYCSYCGARLYFDNGSKNININYKNEDVAKIKEIEVNRELELNKRQGEIKHQNKLWIIALLCVVLMIVLPNIAFMPEENKSKAQEKELQSIANEIYIDINAGNYETALIKAKSLHYTAGWSHEIEEKWDDTREALIKIIEEKMK